MQEDAVMENSGGEVILCNEENCLSGKIRKLMVSTTSVSTIKTAPKRLNDREGADAREKKGRKVDSGKDEDIMDMTEMDYSPAKRKPPIHN
ncbi:hypothetical protein Nepgr_022425 [Nepenthes gracilis]|uniref:Uncharacterized protein n=1 Tax=Nepenthes gracilis TaxID=150966 RepID=A0AAD3T0W0_NEPGR|nr:hypothetical protein Nepgr_022425 [Nepenthes gracilis]